MRAASDETAELLNSYDVGMMSELRLLGGGMFLKPLLVVTDQGKYVLRGHAFRSTARQFQVQAEVVNRAADLGVRCPRVLRDHEGYFGHDREGVCWAVHEYLEGNLYTWPAWRAAKRDASFLRGLGNQVAATHHALAGIEEGGSATLSPSLPPIQFRFLDEIRQHWDSSLDALERQASAPAPRTTETFLCRRQRLAEPWEWLGEQVEALGIAQWPRQLVHGDVSPVNLVFDEAGREFGLIDWDCLHDGLRLYDALGDVLNRPPVEFIDAARYESDAVQCYLEGYCDHAKPALTAEEIAAVPVFCLARQLEDLRQRLHVLATLPDEQDEVYAQLVEARLRIMEDILGRLRPRP
ncbi:MAG: phosphotransferase [Armatimonadetes bacterium]|nr:phosphotransferase [Armatimonadota bacterium]